MKSKRKIYRINIGNLAFSVRIRRLICSLAIVFITVLFGIIGVVHIFSNKVDNNDIVSENEPILAQSEQSFVVCIDPGHGAYDEGGKYNGVKEKDVDLEVGLRVGQILEENNIKVVYTRKDDNTPLGNNQKEDLKKRVQISKDSKANIFVSIHCNQYDDDDDSVNGVELWCNLPKTKDETLAKTIEDELGKLKYTKVRGIRYKKDTSLYVLSKNEAISALVEIGYLSNSSDCQFISSKEGQDKCAEAIAKAILDFKGNM